MVHVEYVTSDGCNLQVQVQLRMMQKMFIPAPGGWYLWRFDFRGVLTVGFSFSFVQVVRFGQLLANIAQDAFFQTRRLSVSKTTIR